MATLGQIITKTTMVSDLNTLQVSKNNSLNWSDGGNGVTAYNPADQPVDGGWSYITFGGTTYSSSTGTGAGASANCASIVTTSVSPVNTSQLTTPQISASDIVTSFKNLAKNTTRVRLYRVFYDYLWGNGCANQDFRDRWVGRTGVGDSNYAVSSLQNSWQISALNTQIDNASSPAFGDRITADSINNFVTAITNIANQSSSGTYAVQCNRNACHCNCHTSCHASRARR